MRPSHAFGHSYMFMRPPPMTQRTIVTTRIPRPPMPIPYNPFFGRGFFGGMHRSHSPFYDAMAQMYGDEDEEEEERHCNPNPCQNGATCNEVKDGYECMCTPGFKGTDCEEENKCHPNPCRNGGICTEANGAYICTCMEGYKGMNCE
ncbi:EGF-like repeat and discoidin I-like domain-containing protein 3, partial [Stylophora pistillata]|uniref:EGF-like repeat and discoidin I-like domain-containing protein 3 n=1 Tax=Stylophora pistillata TaxID=50429 RepID=UPI000C03F826